MLPKLPTISLCMIVRNEAQNIELALKSACPFVDEIVIIDTGSTDNTVEICRKYTEKIYSFKWLNDFSAARNEAIKYATQDWILMLDADELLDQLSAGKLKPWLTEQAANAQVFSVLIYDIPLEAPERFIAQPELLDLKVNQAHQNTRLLRNHLDLQYKYALHELIPHVPETMWRSELRLLHYGYHLADDSSRFPRNMACLQHDLVHYPNDPYVLFNYARTLSIDGQYAEAVAAYEQAIAAYLKNKTEQFQVPLSLVYAHYAGLLFERKEYPRAEKIVFQWLTRLQNNFDIRPHIFLAKIKYMSGDTVGAFRLFTLIEPRLKDLPLSYKNVFFEDIPHIYADVYYFLGALYLERGEAAQALRCISIALEYRPDMPALLTLKRLAEEV